jgi:scyllo-inositol 2-dehydrogenase (NADP+)
MSTDGHRVNCGVVGYGFHHDFGRMHCRWISACDELELTAICDVDPRARERAANEFPYVTQYSSIEQMLADDDLDMVSLVTPHFTHADLAVQCLRAGKHVVVEKAMAVSVDQCTLMIEEARRAERKLAVFHNRRHDGNYRAIQQTVASGTIGDVFHVECCEESFGRPQQWWYSEHDKSGGVFFYWGPHAVDWVLNLMPTRVVRVAGSTQRRVWPHVDIADEVRAHLWFEDGATALISFSRIAAIPKPLWRVLGTCGAIEDSKIGRASGAYISGYQEVLVGEAGQGQIRVVTVDGDEQHETMVDYLESDWLTYYQDMADAVLHDAPLPVSGEEGRLSVAVMEAAQQSGENGGTIIEIPEYD